MNSLSTITELKVRLQHEKFSCEAAADLLDELIELGPEAESLIPLLVSRLSDNSFPAASFTVVSLFEATRSPELLNYIRTPDFWARIGVHDRCQLFAAGVSDLEPGLLNYLWQHFSDPADSNRTLIVQGLAIFGSRSAIDVLDLIDSRISSELPERSLAAPSNDGTLNLKEHLERVELSLQQQFVHRVRETCLLIKARNP
jgi:hypothetical protein